MRNTNKSTTTLLTLIALLATAPLATATDNTENTDTEVTTEQDTNGNGSALYPEIIILLEELIESMGGTTND